MVTEARRFVLALGLCSALAPAAGAGQEPAAAETRGWLGVRVEERYHCGWETAEDWKNCDLETRIRELQEDGPAARAGLLVGDRVVAIDGREITVGSLPGALIAIRPGAAVWVEVVREGERRSVHVIPAVTPPDPVRVRMIGRPGVPTAGGLRDARVFVLRFPGPVGSDQAGFALTVRDTEDEAVAVEPSAVRVVNGRLEVSFVRDRPSPEFQELRRALLGSLERESESAYRDVSTTLQRVGRVRARLPSIEFRRSVARLAGVALAEPGLAIRFDRTFAGAEFESVRDFSGRPGLGGLLVLRVVPGTMTARLGLRAGDLLVRAGGEPIREVQDLIAAIDAAEGEGPTVEWIGEGHETRRAVWPRR
ncbi:PDZ domain-containing protein [Candidatus Palauibacter sp.]|uniref:PDZ domain-containing protein n=1 Tax=Candidatus Palauibacter sp. TaxID=3101350 RepID=UPI003B0206B7